MNVIIAGDGKMGFTLAERMSDISSNHVTMIDTDADALTSTAESIDVRIVQGSAASVQTLKDAGISKTDLFIATTDSDERNLLACLIAKKLGAAHTVARTRDPGYEEGLAMIRADLGVDRFINPERIIAEDIGRLLEYPVASNIEVFARGRVEVIEITVDERMPLVGMALKDIPRRLPSGTLIGAILRGDDVIIPTGDTRVLNDDRVFLVGLPHRVSRFCDAIGLRQSKIRSVMIVGGGRVAYYLAKYLTDIDIKVKIIERDECRCEELSRLLPECLIVQGDGSDDRFLASESMGDMDGFVAVTGMDEENLMTALMAKRAGVPKVVAKINRIGYLDIVKDMGIDNIVCPRLITTYTVVRYAKGLANAHVDTINTIHPIVGGQAEAIEFTADKTTRFLDIPLHRLMLIPNVLVAVLVRKNEVIIPGGNDAIRVGDTAILFAKGVELYDLNEILIKVRD